MAGQVTIAPRGPSAWDALSSFADVLSGRQREQKAQDDAEEQRRDAAQRAYLINVMSGLTYAQKKQVLDANPHLAEIYLPDLPGTADDAKDAELRRIIMTPWDKQTPHERMIDQMILTGKAPGAAGDKAATMDIFGSPAEAHQAATNAAGLTQTADQSTKSAEQTTYHGRLAAAHETTANAYAGTSAAHARLMDTQQENAEQLQDPNSGVIQGRIAVRKAGVKTQPDPATVSLTRERDGYLKQATALEAQAVTKTPGGKPLDANQVQMINDKAGQLRARANEISRRLGTFGTRPQAGQVIDNPADALSLLRSNAPAPPPPMPVPAEPENDDDGS